MASAKKGSDSNNWLIDQAVAFRKMIDWEGGLEWVRGQVREWLAEQSRRRLKGEDPVSPDAYPVEKLGLRLLLKHLHPRMSTEDVERAVAQNFEYHVGDSEDVDGIRPLYLGPNPSLAAKCTALSAVFDHCLDVDPDGLKRRCRMRSDLQPISPWRGRSGEQWRESSTEEWKSALRYEALVQVHVPRLNEEEDSETLKEWLEDVTGALKRLELGKVVSGSTESKLSKLHESAYQSFQMAQAASDLELTDRQAYDWLMENGPPEYELPEFDTWQRYVREGRKFYGTQKNTPRGGRTGRSIVSPEDFQTRRETS